MDKNEREGMTVVFGLLFTFIGIALVITIVMVCSLRSRLKTLETKQARDMSVINNRVTNVAGNLQNDINNVLEWAEENSVKISELRSRQSATNKALNRLRKLQDMSKSQQNESVPVTNSETTYIAEYVPNLSKEDVEMTEIKAGPEGMTYMGTWDISAYEYTGNPTASGTMPTEWHTCAFNSAPLGATVYIPDLGYFVNEDVCGTPSRLDIFLGDVSACEQFGVQSHDVYIVN